MKITNIYLKMYKMLASLASCQQLMYATNDPELAHFSSMLKKEYLVDMLLCGVRFCSK